MEVRNLRVTCQYEDGAYLCLIDILDSYTLVWDEDVIYVARNGDSAPVNIWIISQIETGQFDPIDACPIPSETITGNDTSPTVI